MGINRLLRTLRGEFLDPAASAGHAEGARAASALRTDDPPVLRLASVADNAAPPLTSPGRRSGEVEGARRGPRRHPAIVEMLEADHAEEGRLVGLTLGSQEAMQRGIDRRRAAFLGALQVARDDVLDRSNGLHHGLLEVGTGSDVINRKMKFELECVEREVEALDTQKDLAVEDDGWFRAVVHAYSEGFHRGQHEKHFGGGRFFE